VQHVRGPAVSKPLSDPRGPLQWRLTVRLQAKDRERVEARAGERSLGDYIRHLVEADLEKGGR
jgi:hypothetical protein